MFGLTLLAGYGPLRKRQRWSNTCERTRANDTVLRRPGRRGNRAGNRAVGLNSSHIGVARSLSSVGEKSAKTLANMGFDGYALGGLAVGEPRMVMLAMIECVLPSLPCAKVSFCGKKF
jgi:hypothetical protein